MFYVFIFNLLFYTLSILITDCDNQFINLLLYLFIDLLLLGIEYCVLCIEYWVLSIFSSSRTVPGKREKVRLLRESLILYGLKFIIYYSMHNVKLAI